MNADKSQCALPVGLLQISAAVALELLYFFCLAHQTSFDVRWMRTGTVAGSLIQPLASRVASGGNLEVQGRCRVQQVLLDDQGERVTGIQYTNADGAMQVWIRPVGVAVVIRSAVPRCFVLVSGFLGGRSVLCQGGGGLRPL